MPQICISPLCGQEERMSSLDKKPYFPLFIDISKKRIVVIGGGKIGERRIETLLEFSDHIVVISPKVTDRLKDLSRDGRIEWISDVYREEMTEGADLVLAATDDAACNTRVVEDCRARGIPVNTSHRKELCDFYFPGIIRQENLVMGFSSGGQDHRKVRELREKAEHFFDETG